MISSPQPMTISDSGKKLEVLVDDAPASIISANDPWKVHIEWEIDGLLTPSVAGSWEVKVCLESLDGQPDVPVGTIRSELSAGRLLGPDRRRYQADIEVSAAVSPGLYKVIATVSLATQDGGPGPLSGFTEERVLQFFDPGDLDEADKARARHSTLVNKKFRQGLSADEEKEMAQINAFLDAYEAPFYEPFKKKLMALYDKLLTQSGQPQPKEK